MAVDHNFNNPHAIMSTHIALKTLKMLTCWRRGVGAGNFWEREGYFAQTFPKNFVRQAFPLLAVCYSLSTRTNSKT